MTRKRRPRGHDRPAAAATEQSEQKRARRLERQLREAAARKREQRRKRVVRAGVAAVVVAGVGAAAFVVLRPDPEVPGVERLQQRGRDHVAAPTFDSPTPTSGAHLAQAPRCGSVSQPLDPGLAVHALEHGVVVVWYRAGDDDLGPQLGDLLARWDSHVIISPNDSLEDPIVATAWNRRATYQRPGAPLEEFVDTYRRRGPERVACDA